MTRLGELTQLWSPAQKSEEGGQWNLQLRGLDQLDDVVVAPAEHNPRLKRVVPKLEQVEVDQQGEKQNEKDSEQEMEQKQGQQCNIPTLDPILINLNCLISK